MEEHLWHNCSRTSGTEIWWDLNAFTSWQDTWWWWFTVSPQDLKISFFSLYIVISCCNEHLFGLLYLYSDSQLLCFVIVVPVSLSLFFILVGLARQIVICRDRQRPHVTLMYAYVSARLPVCLHTFVHMFTCTFVICVYACICMQGHMYE